jgi:hypothetical protein
MSATFTPADRVDEASTYDLTPQQVLFYESFGFLHLPGLFRDETAAITAAFEEVFASAPEPFVMPPNPYHEARDPRHADEPRIAVTRLDEIHPLFAELSSDHRMRAVARSLLGPSYEYQGTDGNLFFCDVHWHIDGYGTTTEEEHIKAYFYLDALRSDSGALRVLPGTHIDGAPYTDSIRQLFFDIESAPRRLGVELDEIPGYTIEVDPGDVIIGNFRTIHGSYGGGPRRRLVTMDFHRAES